MRAVFTMDLTRDGKSPSDSDLVAAIRSFGFELKNMPQLTASDIRAIMGTKKRSEESPNILDPDVSTSRSAVSLRSPAPGGERNEDFERNEHYARLAIELFDDMPEVAAAEQDAVIFTGYIQSFQVLFVVTRLVDAYATFRLLHQDFNKLRLASEMMISKILSARINDGPLLSENPTVNIYERGHDHVIMKGRVITRPALEALRSDLKDSLLFVVPLILFIPTVYVVLQYPEVSPNPGGPVVASFWKGMLERLSTALITTSLVSLLGLTQTWWEIRNGRIIDWEFRQRAD
jgi:hypothetical protein